MLDLRGRGDGEKQVGKQSGARLGNILKARLRNFKFIL